MSITKKLVLWIKWQLRINNVRINRTQPVCIFGLVTAVLDKSAISTHKVLPWEQRPFYVYFSKNIHLSSQVDYTFKFVTKEA